jgi:hypothetical protein
MPFDATHVYGDLESQLHGDSLLNNNYGANAIITAIKVPEYLNFTMEQHDDIHNVLSNAAVVVNLSSALPDAEGVAFPNAYRYVDLEELYEIFHPVEGNAAAPDQEVILTPDQMISNAEVGDADGNLFVGNASTLDFTSKYQFRIVMNEAKNRLKFRVGVRKENGVIEECERGRVIIRPNDTPTQWFFEKLFNVDLQGNLEDENAVSGETVPVVTNKSYMDTNYFYKMSLVDQLEGAAALSERIFHNDFGAAGEGELVDTDIIYVHRKGDEGTAGNIYIPFRLRLPAETNMDEMNIYEIAELLNGQILISDSLLNANIDNLDDEDNSVNQRCKLVAQVFESNADVYNLSPYGNTNTATLQLSVMAMPGQPDIVDWYIDECSEFVRADYDETLVQPTQGDVQAVPVGPKPQKANEHLGQTLLAFLLGKEAYLSMTERASSKLRGQKMEADAPEGETDVDGNEFDDYDTAAVNWTSTLLESVVADTVMASIQASHVELKITDASLLEWNWAVPKKYVDDKVASGFTDNITSLADKNLDVKYLTVNKKWRMVVDASNQLVFQYKRGTKWLTGIPFAYPQK